LNAEVFVSALKCIIKECPKNPSDMIEPEREKMEREMVKAM
jgi:hypothetical protein